MEGEEKKDNVRWQGRQWSGRRVEVKMQEKKKGRDWRVQETTSGIGDERWPVSSRRSGDINHKERLD